MTANLLTLLRLNIFSSESKTILFITQHHPLCWQQQAAFEHLTFLDQIYSVTLQILLSSNSWFRIPFLSSHAHASS